MKVVAYPTCELGDVAELYDSLHQTPTYANEGYPMIRVTDIRRGFLDTTNAMKVTQEVYEQFAKKHKPQIGDILFSRVGSYGNSTFVDKRVAFCLGQNTVCISPDRQKIQPSFLYGALNSDDIFHQIRSYVSGASQGTISLKSIRKLQVPVPPLPVQQRIASILSAYDELIENSQRRIKILEAMARGLYRDWFVHFRFPGHESHPRVVSTAGEIPKGWEVKKLGDISSYINRGITPTYDDEGDSIVINQKCVRDQRLNLEPSRKQSKAVSNEKRVCFGDVLVNSTGVGTLGRVAQVYENLENYTVDTHVTIARAKRDIDLDFYGCCLLSLQETFERMGVGATGQTELGRAAISDIDLAIPPIILQQQFGKSVHGIRSAAETYAKKIQNLRRTRDLLLPRLLSGQIEVKVA